MSSAAKVQTVYVVRHADRMDRGVDSESIAWQKASRVNGRLPEDTPISAVGRKQAGETGAFLLKDVPDLSKCTIICSPWLRTMQTARPFVSGSKIPLRLDPALGEGLDYCSHAAPPHAADPEFKNLVEPSYKPLLDGPPDAKMETVARAFLARYPFVAGETIVFFSHAEPVVQLVRELSGRTLDQVYPAAPCSMFKLQRTSKGAFSIAINGGIDHMSVFGPTRPWTTSDTMFDLAVELSWPPPAREVNGGQDQAQFFKDWKGMGAAAAAAVERKRAKDGAKQDGKSAQNKL